jgi:hypothetical protein
VSGLEGLWLTLDPSENQRLVNGMTNMACLPRWLFVPTGGAVCSNLTDVMVRIMTCFTAQALLGDS